MSQNIYDSLQARYDLLNDCTARIELTNSNGHGSGFFVAPNLFITCFHVVEKATTDTSKLINIFWKDKIYAAEVETSLQVNQAIDLKKIDLALLRVKDLNLNHPCVYLDNYNSNRIQDRLYSYGYTDINKYGESSTFSLEGFIDLGDSLKLLKFKQGQVRPRASGSPLMNERTTKVCGVVKSTRDRANDIGGGAVPGETIFACWPELIELQREFHQKDNRWNILLPSSPDYDSLEDEYKFILQKLESMGAGFGNKVPENAKKGFEYLTSALYSDFEESRSEQIKKANEEFTNLVTFDNSKGILTGVSGRKIEEKFINSLGYWGNFKCFDMLNEKRSSYIQVYKCTIKWYDVGCQIFPSRFFDTNYSLFIEDLKDQLEEVELVYNRIKTHTSANYRLWKAGKVTGIIGLVGGAAVSAFMFGNNLAAQTMLRGGNHLFNVKIPKPKDTIIEKLKEKIDDLNLEITDKIKEIINECERKINRLSEDYKSFEKESNLKNLSKVSVCFNSSYKVLTPVSLALGIDYLNLKELLSQKLWKEANLETYQIMVRLVGQEIGESLDSDAIRIFPCSDMQTIDKLWVNYSNGHFGFSVQKKIYQELRNYDAFCEKVGWTREGLLGRLISYEKIIWSLDAPKGHLPYHLWANIESINEDDVIFVGEMLSFWEDYIFSRYEKSELLAVAAQAYICPSSGIEKSIIQ